MEGIYNHELLLIKSVNILTAVSKYKEYMQQLY